MYMYIYVCASHEYFLLPCLPLSSHQLIRLITELEEVGGEGGRGAHSKLKERLTHFNTTAAAMIKVCKKAMLFCLCDS